VSANGTTIDYYVADVITATDYFPFGMAQPGRKYEQAGKSYRYSINGQEKEKELNENITSAEYWMYDSRIGRRWNVDPVVKEYESPYAAFGNNPIWFADPNGSDTSKYLSSKQTVDAIKVSYEVIKKRLDDKKYSVGGDYKAELNAGVAAYYKNNQDLSFGAIAEFSQQVLEYEKGLREVVNAANGGNIFRDYGEKILYNKSVSNVQTVLSTQTLVNEKNGQLLAVITMGANVAMGTAAGAVGIGAGAGLRGTQIKSTQQQEIVSIGIRNSVPKSINLGQQGKHIVGHNNYTPGRSILTGDAKALLDEFHSGTATILRQPNANRVIVEFNIPIGTYIKEGITQGVSTTRGTINFGKNGAHIVPSAPK